MMMLVMRKMVTTMLVEDLDRCDVWTVWPVAPLIHRQTDLLKKIANQFFGHILKPVAMFFNLYYNVNI